MTFLDRLYDWTTNPATPGWKPALAGVSILAGITGIIILVLALTHASLSCPAGQHLTVTGYTYGSTTIGSGTSKVTIPVQTPVYECSGGS